jgi:hypothetical protein
LFHSPANVVTVFGDSVVIKESLQNSNQLKREAALRPSQLTFSSETLSTRRHNTISSKKRRSTLIDVRKEKCIGASVGPILAPQPQMVAADKALPAGADVRIPVIISQFDGLIHRTVTVSQVRRLRRPQVGVKTFV